MWSLYGCRFAMNRGPKKRTKRRYAPTINVMGSGPDMRGHSATLGSASKLSNGLVEEGWRKWKESVESVMRGLKARKVKETESKIK